MSSASFRTFSLDDPNRPDYMSPVLALGHTIPSQWFLVHPNIPEDPMDNRREYCALTVALDSDPAPLPLSNGNVVIALKNHKENYGMLEDLERAGIVKGTGVVCEQGYVKVPMVEVLLPEEELIHRCADNRCRKWEMLGEPKFQRCGKCKITYYCSAEVCLRHIFSGTLVPTHCRLSLIVL